MVKCSFCGFESAEGLFKQLHEPWRYRLYTVRMLECPKYKGVFNHYGGISPGGLKSEFMIKVKPKRST